MTLRELRESKKLTQNDVAFALDVSQAAVSYWESGKNPVTRKYARKLADLLGVDVSLIQESVSLKQKVGGGSQ